MINPSFTIRPMRPEDNAAMLGVIRECVLEFGYTHSPYLTDPAEADIYGGMQGARSRMYVITAPDGAILGGGGYAPVAGHPHLCEIKRVYFSPRARGHGLGRTLVARLMAEAAEESGYTHFYIESVPEMATALTLYEKLGFVYAKRQGDAGHGCCSIFMLRPLDERKTA